MCQEYMRLSLDAVHCSVTALGRHLSSEPVEGGAALTVSVEARTSPAELLGTVEHACRALTSVYWIPIFELLDARGFAVFLVNARDAKHVPGRKTDVSDAQWLQRLHTHGLLRVSFRPKGQITELRAYLRQRERPLE
jgi:transposase